MTRGREYLRYVTSTLAGRRFNLLILFVTSRCNAKWGAFPVFWGTKTGLPC